MSSSQLITLARSQLSLSHHHFRVFSVLNFKKGFKTRTSSATDEKNTSYILTALKYLKRKVTKEKSGFQPRKRNKKDYSIILKQKKPFLGKRKLVEIENVAEGFQPVIAIATARAYDLEALTNGLNKESLYLPVNFLDENKYPKDVIMADAMYQICGEQRFIYFFKNGVIVCWNMKELEISTILPFIALYELESYEEELVYNELEVVGFKYHRRKTSFLRGSVFLQSGLLIKELAQTAYPISHAMALSVKLGIWEKNLEHHADKVHCFNLSLKTGSMVTVNRKKITKCLGELFHLKNNVNLTSNLLGTPDFLNNKPLLEHLFNTVKKYYVVDQRVVVLNKKLQHCLELLQMILTHLNDVRHVRLEYTIIALIFIELLLEVLSLTAIIKAIID